MRCFNWMSSAACPEDLIRGHSNDQREARDDMSEARVGDYRGEVGGPGRMLELRDPGCRSDVGHPT